MLLCCYYYARSSIIGGFIVSLFAPIFYLLVIGHLEVLESHIYVYKRYKARDRYMSLKKCDKIRYINY